MAITANLEQRGVRVTISIIDLHCDTILELYEKPHAGSLKQNSLSVDIAKLQAAPSLAQFFAVFIDKKEPGDVLERALAMIDLFHCQLAENYDTIRLARNWQEVEQNHQQGCISAFLTIEEGAVIKGQLSHLRNLHRLGVRLMTLTWNYPNELGFPNSEPEYRSQGLTEQGKAVVAEMNKLGMIIDVSHLSDQGFYDVASCSQKPFIASHSNARALTAHSRNLTDDMIRKLAEKGGVTGLNFARQFLGTSPVSLIADMVAHCKYIVNTGGEDVLALGSDFDGIDPELEIRHSGELGRLIAALQSAGFSSSQLEKFAWRNAARVIRDILD